MHKKLKILVVSETYPLKNYFDGAAIFTERLARGLAARGHKVLAIGPNSELRDQIDIEGPNLKVFRLKSFRVKPIHPYFRFVYYLDLYQRVKAEVEKFSPDIVHIQNHFYLGRTVLRLSRKMRVPIGGTNHFMPENLIQWMPFGKRETSKIMWLNFRQVYEKLDFVTAPTKAAARLLKKIGFKKNIFVISNGIDLNKFKKHPVDKDFLNRLGINKELPTFLFVGRIDWDKNVDLILRAFDLALRRKAMQLLIVGVGPKESEYKELTGKAGIAKSVVFTGRVSEEELIKIHRAADVYVASGEAELQGIAIMEAMAAGLPVLGIDAVAIPELVKDGINGYLFKKDTRDLANKMVRILEDKDKLKLMGEKSLEIIKKHDIDKVIENFEELYLETITKFSKK